MTLTLGEVTARMEQYDTKDEWLAARLASAGGSDVAAIVGAKGARPAYETWCSKTDDEPQEDLAVDKPWLAYGNDAEAGILRFYERSLPEGHTMVAYNNAIWRGLPGPLHFSPDALVFDDDGNLVWGVDAKNVGVFQRDPWGEPGSDVMPQRCLVQGVMGCAHFEVPRWDFAVAIGGMAPETYACPSDGAVAMGLVNKSNAWWQLHVIGNVAPDPDGSDAADDAIKAKYPTEKGAPIEALEDDLHLARAYSEASETAKNANASKKKIAQQMKVRVGDAPAVSGLWTYHQTKDSTVVDANAIMREYERLLETYYGGDPAAIIADIRNAHTTTKPGHRTLRCLI